MSILGPSAWSISSQLHGLLVLGSLVSGGPCPPIRTWETSWRGKSECGLLAVSFRDTVCPCVISSPTPPPGLVPPCPGSVDTLCPHVISPPAPCPGLVSALHLVCAHRVCYRLHHLRAVVLLPQHRTRPL